MNALIMTIPLLFTLLVAFDILVVDAKRCEGRPRGRADVAWSQSLDMPSLRAEYRLQRADALAWYTKALGVLVCTLSFILGWGVALQGLGLLVTAGGVGWSWRVVLARRAATRQRVRP